VTVQTPQSATNYLLGYDQVGSLKAVAAMDGENEGRVVKVMDYDAFGNILADSNPALFIPLSFAGGLRDRFTGLVRFCHRDYDPTVGRFTAPDPLGDTGGDHDLYDYCVDEPVGRIDPEGLEEQEVENGLADRALKGLSKTRGLEDYGDGLDSPVDWDSGDNGRSASDGPRYGNWGGRKWSGGWNPAEHGDQDGGKPPVDSSDELYREHDICTGAAKGSEDKGKQQKCDDVLANDLKKLPENPKDWPKPPKEGDEEGARWFKDKAIWWFSR
jgi:RHS repeat-associated protein